MINQQLLEYVRQQVAAGVAKEEILKALISQGWNEQDVDSSFAALQPAAAPIPTPVPAPTPAPTMAIWTKGIPRTNIRFMVVSLLLVCGLDLTIAVSSPDLMDFWYIMLGVLAVFLVFFYIENFVFSKKFADTKSGLDPWIFAMILVRNIIFVLNFIPLIQLIGLAADMYIGWIVTLIYVVLIVFRFNQPQSVNV